MLWQFNSFVLYNCTITLLLYNFTQNSNPKHHLQNTLLLCEDVSSNKFTLTYNS